MSSVVLNLYYRYGILVLTAVGTVANFVCALRIWKSYNTSLALYLAVAMVTILKSICLCLATGSLFISLVYIDHRRIICKVVASTTSTAFITETIMLAVLSFFRYKVVICENALALNQRQVKVVKGVFGTTVVGLILFMTTVTIKDVPVLPVLEYCMNGENARPISPIAIFLTLPQILASLMSVVFDFRTWMRARDHVTSGLQSTDNDNQNKNQARMLRAPLKASFVSAAILLLSLLLNLLATLLSVPLRFRLYFLTLIANLLLFRSPVFIAFVYKSNQVNQAQDPLDGAELRERKRQEEIAYALANRRERRRPQENMPTVSSTVDKIKVNDHVPLPD